MVFFSYALLLGIPIVLVSVAAYADIRSRRGYGITLLALVLLGLAAWVETEIEIASHSTSSDNLGLGVALLVFLILGSYLALVLWIGALVEAAIARQWGWLVSFVVTALLSFAGGLVMIGPHSLPQPLFSSYPWLGRAMLWTPIVLPAFVILAYGVYRCVRPARPGTPANAPVAAP